MAGPAPVKGEAAAQLVAPTIMVIWEQALAAAEAGELGSFARTLLSALPSGVTAEIETIACSPAAGSLAEVCQKDQQRVAVLHIRLATPSAPHIGSVGPDCQTASQGEKQLAERGWKHFFAKTEADTGASARTADRAAQVLAQLQSHPPYPSYSFGGHAVVAIYDEPFACLSSFSLSSVGWVDSR